eukprot:12073679-Ditylum_brightwellii.AAC.1
MEFILAWIQAWFSFNAFVDISIVSVRRVKAQVGSQSVIKSNDLLSIGVNCSSEISAKPAVMEYVATCLEAGHSWWIS